MKTTSIAVQTLCVPCANRCRYCLLSWDGRVPGADYERSKAYALRFYEWLRENRPELSFQFYFGYSMEHPALMDAIDFMGSIGSVGGQYLQLDGLAFRDEARTAAFLAELKSHGIRAVNLTFYGLADYHDRFAGRQGDFDYLMTILRAAKSLGLEVSAGAPLTRENAGQAEALVRLLEQNGVPQLRFFIPHGEGRGASLAPIRLREQDLRLLPETVRARLNPRVYRTEREWLRTDPLPLPDRRMLTVSLTADNVDFFEKLPFDQTIGYLEQLDTQYYAALPPMHTLLARYGDGDSDALYSFRDLCLHLGRRHLAEHPNGLPDVTDERGCFSRRY